MRGRGCCLEQQLRLDIELLQRYGVEGVERGRDLLAGLRLYKIDLQDLTYKFNSVPLREGLACSQV